MVLNREMDEEVEMMLELLQAMKVGVIPRRTSSGTRGKRISLVSNLFGVSSSLNNVYHYDVSIVALESNTFQRPIPVAMNRRIIAELARSVYLDGRLPAYDGRSNMYLAHPLPTDPVSAVVTITADADACNDEFARVKQFQVTIQLVATIPLNGLRPEVIQALDVVVRTGSAMAKNMVPVGRSFFTRQPGDYLIGNCREMWLGYYSSIRPGQCKPLLNVDISATLFHESLPLVDYVMKFLKKTNPGQLANGLVDFERRKLELELQAVKIEVTHLPYKRRYKVSGISKKPVSQCIIAMEGRSVSVVQYFSEQYNITLKFPGLQCVLTRGKDGGTSYIPMEVCKTIAGQHAKIVGPDETSRLSQKTATKPIERFQKINEFVHSIVDVQGRDIMKEFDLEVNLEPERVNGRVLPPPKIQTGTKPVLPTDGQWQTDKFLVGADVGQWGIADCCGARRTLELSKSLQDLGKKLGMNIPAPRFIKIYKAGHSAYNILSEIKSVYPETKLTIFVLGNYTSYESIKQVSENNPELVMMTQCVKGSNIDGRKFDRNYVINLLMKINSKMGGINNGIIANIVPEALTRPFIVFGADVSHPGPLNKKHPSIAAIVASLDHIPSQYYCVTSFQQNQTNNRLEYIANLKDMVKECLRQFYRTNRTKPLHLFFFRDGVSEGQFPTVRAYEVLQIRLACKELDDEYEPPLTFLVVQKRHHVRFRPEFESEGRGKGRNIPAGTVVEEKVTHPTNFDFFLCSHAGLQGTSRPAHYQVIHDDVNMSADELQALSFNLCHTYGRCSKSVSIPAPVYYAHLAAARSRDHLKALNDRRDSSLSGSSNSADQLTQLKLDSSIVCKSLRSRGYFL